MLCKKFNLQNPERIKTDARMGGFIACVTWFKKKYWVRVNPKIVSKARKWEILHAVLHELGHVTNNFGTSTVEREYFAEQFALEKAKELYPQFYDKFLGEVINIKNSDRGYYRTAFTRLLNTLGEKLEK